MNEKRLAVQGSRSLTDDRVKVILIEEIMKHQPTTIVTSEEPDGVCRVAQRVAKEEAIPLKVHFLNFKFLRGAFEHRSKAIQKDCDFCVFIHDGKSKGTSNEIKLAVKMNLPHVIHVLDPADKVDGFGIVDGFGD